ncbi:Fanconi anemia core complex-associated protein 20 isoform X1 [Rattus rattus]|uniref:Fanconi anemia core complex-associated protein 20 isoform X1 n=1 Tax=Rattus rattus TaxID=10117 RepID=UPI0013F3948A|nr:Fanconi anemia core complex-associated protein 20 isoform X1 [Rattus rattus]
MCGPEQPLCCLADPAMFPRQLSHTACLPGTPTPHKCRRAWIQAALPAWHTQASRCGECSPLSEGHAGREAAQASWTPSRSQPPNCRPWFLSEESKSEPWAALLRSTVGGNADWTPNSQPLPPLPAFPSQESLPDPESTVPPEVFTVGSKTFSWTPFPPALRGSGSSCHLLRCPEGSPGSPAPSLKECPALDSRQTPSAQECVPVQSQLVLLNCPLCQKAFDPK